MAKIRKLTLGAVKKENARLEERTLEEVNGYSLEIDKVFRKTKINTLIHDIVDKVEYSRIRNLDLTPIFTPFVALLMIKHFTSLEIPDTFDEQLTVMNLLVDGEFLTQIYELLPADQVELVYVEIERATNRLNENLDAVMQQAQALTLDNRDLLGLEENEE
jgi:hypothetical protein